MKFVSLEGSFSLFLTAFLCAQTAWSQSVACEPKPLAVVGGGQYGKFDSTRFIHRILADGDIAWEDRGDSLDPSELSRYSLILWFSGATEEWSERQIADFKAHLHVLLPGTVSVFDREGICGSRPLVDG